MQAHRTGPTPYRSIASTMAIVWREGGGTVAGGIRSLYRGVTPTTLRGVLISTTQISTYDHTKQMLKRRRIFEEGFKLHIAASSLSGLALLLPMFVVCVIACLFCSFLQPLRLFDLKPSWCAFSSGFTPFSATDSFSRRHQSSHDERLRSNLLWSDSLCRKNVTK